MELLPTPRLINQELSLEEINEIKLKDNFKNIVYHTDIMNNSTTINEAKKECFKNIMKSIINEPEILLININFRNITIRKINEFILLGVFESDDEFIALVEKINRILISITL